MDPIVIIGSGASGVHFALTVLEKGYPVVMLDVGHRAPDPVNPEDDFASLKSNLPDPVEYFLGADYRALILPGHDGEYYGFPPSKSHVFRPHADFRYTADGFSPLLSFAAGGLAEAWTGGCYPFHPREMGAFPFEFRELEPCYATVARRIGISGVADDLVPFFPHHDGLLEPLDLDEHSAMLLAAYGNARPHLNGRLRCYLGRSRVAVLSQALRDRKPCSYLGRCLWGCPSRSFYTPSLTLEECRRYPNFQYLDGVYAGHFRFSLGGRITSLVASPLPGGQTREFPVGTLVLAAGALSSSKILLESIYRDSGELVPLRGLMDNRQVLMPFLNWRMLGRPYHPKNYQYHQLAIAVDAADPMDYTHGLLTTLKTALVHPIIQSIPFDLGTGVSVFRNIHAALGLVNINLSDSPRDDNYVALEPAAGGAPGRSRLVIQYRPAPEEPARLRRAKKTFRKALAKLGCLAPSAMNHVRPMGASVHYAGTVPMSATPRRLSSSPECRSHDFENLYLVDGSTFPALPAKNLTFTLMANAVRVAQAAF